MTKNPSLSDIHWTLPDESTDQSRGRFLGCLLGGAVGDALGAPIEFMRLTEIRERFGYQGVRDYLRAYGKVGAITDDTQMTLFTAEGLLRGWVRRQIKGITTYQEVVSHAYLRWLKTQGIEPAREMIPDAEGWLYSLQGLHHKRAPGLTCLSALSAMKDFGEPAKNNSKGCGGVMRVAPVGLFAWHSHQSGETPMVTFDLAAKLAAITHGHPTGQLASGVFAVLVLGLASGASLEDALDVATACMKSRPRHKETLHALKQARALAQSGLPVTDAIAELGEGWVAEEALAIAVYCALVATSFEQGVVLAINHSGDSDSTGAMTGNLLGALHGVEAIPERWLSLLELKEVIAEIGDDLFTFPEWNLDEGSDSVENILKKYPGC